MQRGCAVARSPCPGAASASASVSLCIFVMPARSWAIVGAEGRSRTKAIGMPVPPTASDTDWGPWPAPADAFASFWNNLDHNVPIRAMPDPSKHGAPLAPPPEELHSLIFDSIHEGVFTVDHDFRVTSFNAEAERITGVPRRQAVGRKCYEVFRASICQHGCALRETLATGRPLRDVRVDVLNAAMLPVPLTVSTAVLRRGDRLVGGVEIFRDITDIESLRNELRGQGAFEDIVGKSLAMQELFRLLPDVAAADAPVLIEGATSRSCA
jgi:PAS domain S-box-containing protein